MAKRFIELPIPVDERVPEGYKLIVAYAKGDTVIVPLDDLPEEHHDCDWEGCGTLNHVVRFDFEAKYNAAGVVWE